MNKLKKENIIKNSIIYKKKLYSLIKTSQQESKPILIQGCGRSGTTMLLNAFIRDNSIETFNENDSRIANNYIIDKSKMQKAIILSKSKFVVMKPILNSFEANQFLIDFPSLKIVWMIRNYEDMVNSSLIKFGDEVANYIKNYIMYDDGDNWITKGIHHDTKRILSNIDFDYNYLNENDWMALIWWSVNRTILISDLFRNKRFLIIKYEELVEDPAFWFKKIYNHTGMKYNKNIIKNIHPKSVGKGSSIEFNPKVKKMCDDLKNQIFLNR